MSNHHHDANQTPVPARARRGPAFSLNPFPRRSSGSQFATPPRFQFPDEPVAGDAGNTLRSSGRPSRGFFRASDRRFDNSSPLKGGRKKPVEISDDEIEDDFDHEKDATGLDDESSTHLDEIFSISRHSNKRPRTSSPSADRPARTENIDEDFDEISDSSSPMPESPSSPVRSRTKNSKLPTSQIERDCQPIGTVISELESFEPVSEPQTPDQVQTLQNEDVRSSIKTTSAFQNRPRFILSANYTPISTATPATSTPQPTRKKPTFVLPRSPSPDGEDVSSSAIPAPFSPVATRTIRRSGRPKSGASATYVPGGMAEHLRDWIMEAEMKRRATSEQLSNQRQSGARFSIIGRIDSCHNAFLKSSGSVIVAQITPEVAPGDGASESNPLTVLLLGAAASRVHGNKARQSSTTSGEKLKPGYVIGIGAGLSWEIEVGSMQANETSNDKQGPSNRVVPSSQSDSEGDLEDQDEAITLAARSAHSTPETWLVAAEWDLLSDTMR